MRKYTPKEMREIARHAIALWSSRSKDSVKPGDDGFVSLQEAIADTLHRWQTGSYRTAERLPRLSRVADDAPASAEHQQKLEYVRSQEQTREHRCHWPGCEQQVEPARWGCRVHWAALPKFLRDRIWATFVPGQERTGTPSTEYVATAADVRRWIASRSDA